MLTATPKVGDRVVIDYNNVRPHPKYEEVTVQKVGNKYLPVDRYRFHLNGKGESVSGYELFDSVEAWGKASNAIAISPKSKRLHLLGALVTG